MTKPSVLLVDGEEIFARGLSRMLETEGYDVAVALGGREGLERISSGSIDVLILDMLMPDVDGVEVLRRAREVSPLTEVVVLTGHGSVSAGLEAMRLGAFDYLLKPCELDDLLDRIRRALEKKAIEEGRTAGRRETAERRSLPKGSGSGQ